MPDETADVLARVCVDAGEIRHALRLSGDGAVLDGLIEAIRRNGQITEHLEKLDAALRRAGDALGIAGRVKSRGGGGADARVVGVSMRKVELVFLCPNGNCSRTWRSGPNADASSRPHCELLDEPLRWERL